MFITPIAKNTRGAHSSKSATLDKKKVRYVLLYDRGNTAYDSSAVYHSFVETGATAAQYHKAQPAYKRCTGTRRKRFLV